MRNVRYVPALALLTVVVTACSGAVDDEAEPTSSVTQSESVSSEPSPTTAAQSSDRVTTSAKPPTDVATSRSVPQPCSIVPLGELSAAGLDANGTTESFVDAAAGPEDAQALEYSGALSIAMCEAGTSTTASFKTYPTPEQARAESAKAIQSNQLDAAAVVTEIAGLTAGEGSIVMNFEYGRAAAQWWHGPINAYVLLTFDQTERSAQSVESLL